MTKRHGWAAIDEANFGGIDDGHNYAEDAFHYVKHRALDLTDDKLRELYHLVAEELNRRDGVTFRQEAAE